MATAEAPTREDFAKLLDESMGTGNLQEGAVIKGRVVGIEKDMAVIDVGLKTEGRVAVREFAGPGRQADLKVGDEVEVYLERVENALGEAVLSRDKARREKNWKRSDELRDHLSARGWDVRDTKEGQKLTKSRRS